MNKFDNNIQLWEQRSSSLTVFLVFILSIIGFQVIGPVIGLFLALPFYDGSLVDFQSDLLNPDNNPALKTPLFIMQACASLIGLVVVPLAYLWVAEKKKVSLFFEKRLRLFPIILSGIIVISFMGVNALFIDWNANIDFPDFMSGFEQWAQKTEALAKRMTDFLTDFDHPGQFVMAFIVIAIIPAFGEELLFRGFIQNSLYNSTKNIHLAIWVAAILFSTIHMQFYGFVPRMLLGALFGYLYYWSGNLIVPVFAHFINNGLTLILLYFYDLDLIETDITNTEASPLYTVGIFAIITAVLVFYFRKYFLKSSVDK